MVTALLDYISPFGLQVDVSTQHRILNLEQVSSSTCQICGKVLQHPYSFKRHMMTHTGSKRCQCPLCGYSAVQISDITKHLRIHFKKGSHACPMCDINLQNMDEFIHHMKVHVKLNLRSTKCQEMASNSR